MIALGDNFDFGKSFDEILSERHHSPSSSVAPPACSIALTPTAINSCNQSFNNTRPQTPSIYRVQSPPCTPNSTIVSQLFRGSGDTLKFPLSATGISFPHAGGSDNILIQVPSGELLPANTCRLNRPMIVIETNVGDTAVASPSSPFQFYTHPTANRNMKYGVSTENGRRNVLCQKSGQISTIGHATGDSGDLLSECIDNTLTQEGFMDKPDGCSNVPGPAGKMAPTHGVGLALAHEVDLNCAVLTDQYDQETSEYNFSGNHSPHDRSVLSNGAWRCMLNEFDGKTSFLERINISAVKSASSKCHLRTVPFLVVFLHHLKPLCEFTYRAVFTDQSGTMYGTVTRELVRNHHLGGGSVLAVHDAVIYRYSALAHYLTVTENNLAYVFSHDAKNRPIVSKFNPVSDHFLRRVQAGCIVSPCSHESTGNIAVSITRNASTHCGGSINTSDALNARLPTVISNRSMADVVRVYEEENVSTSRVHSTPTKHDPPCDRRSLAPVIGGIEESELDAIFTEDDHLFSEDNLTS